MEDSNLWDELFSTGIGSLSEDNAKALIELVLDQDTPTHIKIKIMNQLIEASGPDTFFDLLLDEPLDEAPCPNCGHMSHWAIPEDELNQRGIYTYENDPRVKKHTTAVDCVQYQQACSKSKLSY